MLNFRGQTRSGHCYRKHTDLRRSRVLWCAITCSSHCRNSHPKHGALTHEPNPAQFRETLCLRAAGLKLPTAPRFLSTRCAQWDAAELTVLFFATLSFPQSHASLCVRLRSTWNSTSRSLTSFLLNTCRIYLDCSRDSHAQHADSDRKSTRLNSSHSGESRMPSSA